MSSRSLKEENGTDTPAGSKNKVDNKKIIRVECSGISYSDPNRDRASFALANTLQFAPPCSLKNTYNILKPRRDGLEKKYMYYALT